jgi:hypothetical protein
MEKILTQKNILEEKLKEYIWLVEKTLQQESLRLIKGKKCDRCGRMDRLKIVPLHEYPATIPSKIVLYCSNCKFNKVLLSQESSNMMRYFMEEFQKKAENLLPAESKSNKDEKVITDKTAVDSLIKK